MKSKDWSRKAAWARSIAGFNIQTGDPVAIKMIRPEFSDDPEILDLFRREASILHSFTHDAIVRYFVFSVDPQLGRGPILRWSLWKGRRSRSDWAQGRFPYRRSESCKSAWRPRSRPRTVTASCIADISPDNLIMPDGDVRSAKVIDFGIARARRAGETTILGGAFAGKLNYASPEQLGPRGRRRHREVGYLQLRPCPGAGVARPARSTWRARKPS